MKQAINILTFIFISATAIGQTDSLIVGEYTFVEQRGIHSVPGISYGDMHPTSYISHVDTTITNSLILDKNHNAVLQIDTVVGFFWLGFKPEQKWLGKWEMKDDTLYITFTESSTLWYFTLDGENPKPEIEELPNPVIQKYHLQMYENKIYGPIAVNGGIDGFRYRKKE